MRRKTIGSPQGSEPKKKREHLFWRWLKDSIKDDWSSIDLGNWWFNNRGIIMLLSGVLMAVGGTVIGIVALIPPTYASGSLFLLGIPIGVLIVLYGHFKENVEGQG